MTIYDVTTATTMQYISSSIAGECVNTILPEQLVVIRTTPKYIVTGIAIQCVITRTAP